MTERAEAAQRDRISVCICTYGRPALLDQLLGSLGDQLVDPAFSFNVVVVDNHQDRSAEETVRAFAARSTVQATYDWEPERNISLARNRAIRNATGNLVAFIDDDERPGNDWLVQLHRTLRASDAQGVLGPVLPEFPSDAPLWLKRGKFFDRKRHRTGTHISAGDARTGNLLLFRSIFTEAQCWFDPTFGRTGGEDTDFFARQFLSGAAFVWCDEAAAHETVPPERWTGSFHVKRLLRAGTVDGERMRAGTLPSRGMVVRNCLVFCACAILTPPSLALPKHIWMRVVQKLAYCGGVVTAYFGLSILRYRD